MRARRGPFGWLIGGGATGVAAALALASWLQNPRFFERLVTYRHLHPNTSVDYYTPREVVLGGNAPPLPAAPERLSEQARRQVLAQLDGTRSVALLAAVSGGTLIEHYFEGYHRGTRTNSMSMAKTLLALLIGIAIDEGILASVHEPASRYLPEWRDDARREITLYHLLTMHSGLERDDSQWHPFSDLVRAHLGEDVMAVATAVPAVEPPGARFDYNNINSEILALVLERASGRRFADYLSEKLWRPLGARDAFVRLGREQGTAKAYCCLFATAEDWARVGLLLLGRGELYGKRIVSADWIDAMRAPSPTEPDYGLHVWLARGGMRTQHGDEPFFDPDVLYLDGQGNQRVYVSPRYGLVLVRTGEYAPGWNNTALFNTMVRALSPPEQAELK